MEKMQLVESGPVYWVGGIGKDCQLCDKPYGPLMFDCSLAPIGSTQWANVCYACFQENHLRIGTGLGQKYEMQMDGRWLKVGG